LPSNVNIMRTDMVVTRKMMAGVQTVSGTSADAGGTDVVGAATRPALTFSVTSDR